MKFVILALLASLTSAYVVAPKSFATRQPTKLHESFGFGFAEDTYDNQPNLLKGEAEYKEWVGNIQENSFLNRQVSATWKFFLIFLLFRLSC